MRKETGAVTILMALLMLLITTGVTLMVGSVVKNEIRNSSDDYREQVAYQAASTGIHLAMEYLSKNTGSPGEESVGVFKPIADGDEVCITSEPLMSADVSNECMHDLKTTVMSGVPGRFWVTFCDPNGALPTSSSKSCDVKRWNANEGRVLIYARGQSDDGQASRYITAMASSLSANQASLSSPLTGGNAVSVGGSANIKNPYGRSSIWSGNSISLSNGQKTEVLSPQFAVAEAYEDPNKTAMIIGSKEGAVGPDIIQNDPSLDTASASLDEYTKRFLGVENIDAFKEGAITAAENITSSLADTEKDLGGGAFSGGKYYLTDDDPFGGNLKSIGSKDDPAIIVIDCSCTLATISSNAQIYGVVFITGDAKVTGAPEITGGMVLYGSLTDSGNVSITYDPNVLIPITGESGEVTLIGGSVKDWL